MRHEVKELAVALQLDVADAVPRTALDERARGSPALRSVSACRSGQHCALADINMAYMKESGNGVFTTKLPNPPRLAQCRPDK